MADPTNYLPCYQLLPTTKLQEARRVRRPVEASIARKLQGSIENEAIASDFYDEVNDRLAGEAAAARPKRLPCP